MPTASGKYRFQAPSGEPFGSATIHLIARGETVLGRFGRVGVIHGSLQGRVVNGQWTKREDRGWIVLEFAPDFKSCTYTYGTDGGPALAYGDLLKVSRPARPSRALSAPRSKQ